MDQLVAARPDLQTARSFWTMRRGDSARAFRVARSHSRVVRVLRIAVPISVIITVLAFVLWTWFSPMRLLQSVSNDLGADLVVSGTKITMQQPRITGFTRDSRRYEFTAKAAAQDLTKPDLVDLHDMQGTINMKDNSVTDVVAPSGTYNSKTEILQLGRNTVVTSTSGYKLLLDNATIDIRSTKLVTEEPVHVEMKEGVLDAQRMEVLDSGNTIRFDGVKMDLKGDQLAPPQSGTKQQDTKQQ
jgi:lipopolysaccharide export system protein LptC